MVLTPAAPVSRARQKTDRWRYFFSATPMIAFNQRKATIIAALDDTSSDDKSPKGTVDIAAWPFIELINAQSDYVTTSSCSGRITIYSDANLSPEPQERKKKGGSWVLVSHEPIPLGNRGTELTLLDLAPDTPLCNTLNSCAFPADHLPPMVSFKYEPFILHIEARSIDAGQKFLSLAMQSGYRNSGIVLSDDRCIVAVRSTTKLDAPIGWICECQRVHALTDTSLAILLQMANEKFAQEAERMARFLETLQHAWTAPMVIEGELETKEERRIRKRQEGLLRQQQLSSEKQINS